MLLFKGKTYDTIKYVAQVVLPAIGTLYFAIAQMWSLGHADEVVGTIVAIDTFLGVILHLSSTAYKNTIADSYEGTIHIIDGQANLHIKPENIDNLEGKDTVTFKVEKHSRSAKKTASKKKNIS